MIIPQSNKVLAMRRKKRNKPMRKKQTRDFRFTPSRDAGWKVFPFCCFQYLCSGGKENTAAG